MEKAKTIITISSVFMLIFSYGNISGNIDHFGGSYSDQESSKSVQTKTKMLKLSGSVPRSGRWQT